MGNFKVIQVVSDRAGVFNLGLLDSTVDVFPLPLLQIKTFYKGFQNFESLFPVNQIFKSLIQLISIIYLYGFLLKCSTLRTFET